MGNKKYDHGLGTALIKAKTRNTRVNKDSAGSGKHVSEKDGGASANPLSSYLEGSSIDDFLATAVLANRDFTAMRQSTILIQNGVQLAENLSVQTSNTKEVNGAKAPDMKFRELKVPRRPSWTSSMSAEDLNDREKTAFLAWRRSIAEMEASENLEVTPFEKNLEVWRQLWHVRERSDVLIQIVDARNPLFYRSHDLEEYAKEGDDYRQTLILVNKADYLTLEQREAWRNYFTKEEIPFVFFSAKLAQDIIDEQLKLDSETTSISEEEVSYGKLDSASYTTLDTLSRDQLLRYFHAIAEKVTEKVGLRTRDNGLIKFGMIGFPNVGKSSVINCLLGSSTHSHHVKRVAVGATPGKTKHFQTLILSDRIMLCDCPGLVFPSFVNSKAEMYCCGVLPISQLRDHFGPCLVMCQRIPKLVFEKLYGIKVPLVSKLAKNTDPIDVHLLLESYARYRGYTTTGKGGPDTSRAARDLLRDYVKGKLLYCHPPPGAERDSAFDPHHLAAIRFAGVDEICTVESLAQIKIKENVIDLAEFDLAVNDKDLGSKRSKRHGRKGRKGRDKNPYEDADASMTATVVVPNAGGKKSRRNFKHSIMAHANQ